jgi:hypothetical protein
MMSSLPRSLTIGDFQATGVDAIEVLVSDLTE